MKEPWREQDSDWRVKSLRVGDRKLARNIAAGRFPLFWDGAHDVFHIVTFALYPKFAASLRKGNQKLIKMAMSSSQLSRSSYALEVLALANPKKISEMTEHFALKSPRKGANFEDFHASVKQLSKQDFTDHAQFWVEKFQGFLNRYAGGMAEPYEQSVYREKVRGETWLSHFYEGRWAEETKNVPNELLSDGMTHMDVFLENLLALSRSSQVTIDRQFENRASDGRIELDRLLRLQVARMEYALWKSAVEIGPEQWILDTVVAKVDPNSPTMKFIKDCFGENSITYRMFTKGSED